MPAGRPTKYDPNYHPEKAYKLCLLGATDEEMADIFDVNQDTINEWKNVHPEFSESLKKGKTIADSEVADRLYQRALGFEHDSEEIKVMYDKETNEQKIVRVPIRKIHPPDTTAAIFWLKNRRGKVDSKKGQKWADKQEVDTTVNVQRVTFLDE